MQSKTTAHDTSGSYRQEQQSTALRRPIDAANARSIQRSASGLTNVQRFAAVAETLTRALRSGSLLGPTWVLLRQKGA